MSTESVLVGTLRRKQPPATGSAGRSSKKARKPIACQQCHSRKVKCSFGSPCSNCCLVNRPDECTYPTRDSKITVSQSYIDRILQQNQSLNDKIRQLDLTEASVDPLTPGSPSLNPAPVNTESRNPLLGDRSWFLSLGTTETPIHIGEAADASFATRLRQALAVDGIANHIPRTQYATDTEIIDLSNTNIPWPSTARARLLVKTAIDTVGQCYHCFRISEVWNGLDRHYQNLASSRTIFSCKLEALFALGEAYSSRTQSAVGGNFPGLAYFSRASRTVRRLRERPQLELIEVLLLMVLYSLLLNRRHSAYALANSAVTTSVIIGLHHNMPESVVPDRAQREHRIRLWWTAYTLERLLASKLGQPVSIQDEEISVDRPSSSGLTDLELHDFLDEHYANASLNLARISRQITTSIYSRKPLQISFLQRVQTSLKDLRAWVEDLPSHLQLPSGKRAQPLSRPVKWLHLSFNQYVIQATRPVLLHVLRAHKGVWQGPAGTTTQRDGIGDVAIALAEACIRCARHSYQLLIDIWVVRGF